MPFRKECGVRSPTLASRSWSHDRAGTPAASIKVPARTAAAGALGLLLVDNRIRRAARDHHRTTPAKQGSRPQAVGGNRVVMVTADRPISVPDVLIRWPRVLCTNRC